MSDDLTVTEGGDIEIGTLTKRNNRCLTCQDKAGMSPSVMG